MLKSPRTMISERGDCNVMVSIDLERWSKRSSLLFELGERYRVQFTFWHEEGKFSTRRVESQDWKERIVGGVRSAYQSE